MAAILSFLATIIFLYVCMYMLIVILSYIILLILFAMLYVSAFGRGRILEGRGLDGMHEGGNE